jgi:NAD-dependent DNA ligase
LNFLINYYSKQRSNETLVPTSLGLPRFSKNHPLFAPLPSKNGIHQMKNFVISVTGFIGTERSDLKFLIKAVGAKYSGALSKKENTHLVCCSAEGEKVSIVLLIFL